MPGGGGGGGGGGVPPVCDGRHASVTVALDSTPDGEQDVRIWGPFGSFVLDNPTADDGDGITDSRTFTQVLPGTHNFSVSVPFRWWFSGATCEPAGNCQVNMATRSVAVTVQACDDVTVRVSAQQKGSLTVNSFEDRNGNGEQEEGEQSLSPWWSELTTVGTDGNMRVVASNFDGGSGTWNVFDLVPGREYTVCQKPQDGYTNVAPGSGAYDERGWACYTFTLDSAQAAEAWFGYTAGDGGDDGGDDGEGGELAGAGRGVTFRSLLETAHLFMPTVNGD
jgi:hypothetical protein